MHPRMWAHPATQRNVRVLQDDGHHLLGPIDGLVASGESGVGRLMEPVDIADHVLGTLRLKGRRVLVSAGPTFEAIDPVRFIGNRSSGKMGFAIAQAAAERGASVELVAGPVSLTTPPGVTRHNVRSALEMQTALQALTKTRCDALVMCAAVGDFRPQHVGEKKLERGAGLTLELVANPDIIASLAQTVSPRPLCVAFALETGTEEAIVQRAQAKLARKGVDLVVANAAEDAFEGDTNRAHLVTRTGVTSLPTLPKLGLAAHILDWMESQWIPTH
jgi:phosphopantothenoylcysteine decarboxylase / phosphopantothenate---cysteine ligase